MFRRSLLGFVLVLAACANPVPVGPVPPTPPAPGPVVPPRPPAPVLGTVPYATAHSVTKGMSRASLEALIGFAPVLDTPQDDGTRIARWAAIGSDGSPRWLDVQYGAAGVIGHGLIPRVP